MEKGLLIIMSGPSGVGKGTLRKLIMADKSLNLAYSVSMTTRKPREFERDGIDYFFVSQEQFDKAVENDELLEHVCFVNNSYGTPKAYVEKLQNEGKNVFLEIDVQGALKVLKNADGPHTLSFFVVPPSLDELRRRIKDRGTTETDEVIDERVARASAEIKEDKAYDYIVLNDNIQTCADEIRTLILHTIRKGQKDKNQQKGIKVPSNLNVDLTEKD